jgi:hypothetical protein
LLAHVADLLAIANWQRVQAHSKSRIPPPKPLPRPGVTAPGEKRFGKPQPIARIRERLRLLNERR